MPEIEIRPIVTGDIESLSLFEHSFYSNYVWQMSLDLSQYITETSFRKTRLPRRVLVAYPRKREEIFLQIEQAEAFLIAEIENRPVAYIKLIVEDDTMNIKVTDLVVSASMRRQGIASGLIFAALNLIAHRGYGALIIAVQTKNDPAITLMHKLGFKFCGYRDEYFPNKELALFYSRYAH